MSDDLSALIREAEVLYSQRDWDAALEKYQRVMSLDPSNDEACEKLARVYAIRGQIQQVIATYFQLMDILEERGENDIAIEVARWIMKLQPESDRARMRQIQIFMKKGDRDEVMRQSLELARLYIELGQGDQSIDLLKNAQEMDPENLDIGVELAEMYIRQGHIQDGANQFRKIANTFLDQGKLEKAADAFKRMKLIQPDDPSLLFTLGNIYVNLGKLNEAEAEFRSILRHDLNHLEALMALGNVCQAKGQFRDAILAFNKILSINPQEITAKEKLGELYQAQGNVNEAIKNYLSAAHTYQFEEDVERAVRLYQRVVALDPTNPTACRELTNMGAPLQAAPEDLEPSAFQPVMAPVGEISIPQPGMPEGSDLPAGVVPMDDEGGLTGRGGASPAARTPRGLTSKAGGSGAGKATLPRAGMMTPRGAGLVPKSEGGGGATAGGKKAMGGDSRPTLARSRTSEVSGAKPQLMRGRETDVEMPPIEEEMGYAPQPEMEAPAYPEEPVGQEQGEAEALEQDYVAPEAPQAFTEPPETFEVPTFDPSVLADAAPPPMPAEAAAPVEFPAFDEAPPMPDAEAVHEEPPPEAAWPQPPAAELAASAAPVSPIIESRPSLIRGLTRKSEGTPSGRSVIHEGTSGGRGMGQEGAPGGRGMIKKGGPEPVAEEQSARGLTRKSAPVPEPEPDAEEAGGPRLFSRGGGGGLRKPLRGRLEMPARGGEHGPETHEEPAEAVPMHEAPPMPEMAAPPLPEAAAPGATAAPPDVFAAPEMPPMPYETVEAAAPAEVSAWSETVADSDQAAYEPAIDESPVVAAAAEPPTEAAGVGAGEPPPGGEAQAVEQPAAQPAPAPPPAPLRPLRSRAVLRGVQAGRVPRGQRHDARAPGVPQEPPGEPQ